MSQAQKGICAEPNLHALFLTFTVVDDDHQTVREKLVQILSLFAQFDEEYYEAMLSGFIAIGTEYWYELYPTIIPRELAPFPDVHCEDRNAPISPGDLLIVVKADRMDICHALAVQVMQLLKPHVDLFEEVRGFRYLDGRDLMGFVDGGQNPRGMRKFEAALVKDDDPDFTGGSYVFIQRFRHHMDKWQALPLAQQEQIIGRQKANDRPLEESQVSPSSYAVRASICDGSGKQIKMLTQNMPYGDMSTQGLVFVACAASPEPFRQLLHSRVVGDGQGNYDKLLDYTTAETGGAFFAPSVSFIKKQAKIL
ncbi:Dyp-type peroxidase [Paraglaciecola aestuariivivens]